MASGAFKERFNRRYLRLVRKYSQVIVGQFFGHHHSDSFRVIYSERGQPISWIFLAPSVTPWRTPNGANNPGLRLYKFDTNTGQVLDYVQYYLDLSAANHLDNAEWKVEYNLTSFYGLPNVSAASLHELAETFQTGSQVDAGTAIHGSGSQGYSGSSGLSAVPLPVVSPMLGVDLFDRYYRANSVSYHHGSEQGTCNAACRRGHYCSITQVDYNAFRECVESEIGNSTPGVGSFPSLCALLFLIISLTLVR